MINFLLIKKIIKNIFIFVILQGILLFLIHLGILVGFNSSLSAIYISFPLEILFILLYLIYLTISQKNIQTFKIKLIYVYGSFIVPILASVYFLLTSVSREEILLLSILLIIPFLPLSFIIFYNKIVQFKK